MDPFDPTSTPKKHSSLGRFKHEGANVIVAESGHVVAYSGDDERFDYLYKFVSKDKYREGDRKHNMTLLSAGDLYVARFTGNSPAAEITGTGTVPADGGFDGTGEWLPLVVGGVSKVPGMSVEEVLVYTAWPRTRWAPPRWTAARTSSPACTPARSTSPAPTTRTAARPARKAPPRSTRATPTATATSWKSPRPATRPPRSSPGTC